MCKIAICDDDKEYREKIKTVIETEGILSSNEIRFYEYESGKELLEDADILHDLIFMDIQMPNMNGYQTCLKLRETSNVPILFLTAKGLDSDKTLGFSSGADDYLAKPFSYSELTARVKALLRRYQVYKGKKEEILLDTEKDLSMDGLTLRYAQQNAEVNGKEVELTDIEFNILSTLMKNPKQIFSAEQLYEKAWNEPYYYSANNTIMVHIRNLRKKIEKDPANPVYIKTIWGKGYRFE